MQRYDSETSEVSYTIRDLVPGYYHGTGDVNVAALVTALMNGRYLKDSVSAAVDHVVDSIGRTYEFGTDVRYGANFEEGLFNLTNAIKSH